MCIKTVSTWCVHCPVHNWSLPCLAISLAISVISCCVTESSSFIAIIFVLRKCSVDWHPTLLNHDVTKRMQVITIYALCQEFQRNIAAYAIRKALWRHLMLSQYLHAYWDLWWESINIINRFLLFPGNSFQSSSNHIRCYKNEAELN